MSFAAHIGSSLVHMASMAPPTYRRRSPLKKLGYFQSVIETL